MKLKLFKKNYMNFPNEIKEQVGYDFIIFMTKCFAFQWFIDCGEWFIYITIWKRTIRFSGAGNMYIKHK